MRYELVLDCLEDGAGSCRNEDLIQTLRSELDAARKVTDKIANQRDAARAEAEAARAEATDLHKELDRTHERMNALRAALQSLVDGKSEFDIEYDTGMPADEARKIMDLAYNRTGN